MSELTQLQRGVDTWMMKCFGREVSSDLLERSDRFVEEALELAQTMPGFERDRAHALIDYVFDRPSGDREQEVGGVMVTLAALCNACEISIIEVSQMELLRVWAKIETIREKQAHKPVGSALPAARATESVDGGSLK